MRGISELRDRVLAGAATYMAAEKGDPADAHYAAQLELAGDVLDHAISEYVAASIIEERGQS